MRKNLVKNVFLQVFFCFFLFFFTDNDDVTESVSTADGRAIPSVVLELLLTLGQSQFGSVADGHHGVGLGGAEQPLLVRQSRYLAAYQVSAQSHHRPGREKRRINQKVKWNDERRRRRMSSASQRIQFEVQRYGHVKALNVFSFYDSRSPST